MRRLAMAPSADSTNLGAARLGRLACVFALLSALALVTAATSASAERGTVGFIGTSGTGGGQLDSPVGLAVNDASGDIYVVDAGNSRIQQFDSSGNFIRTWGWDVDATNPATGFEICTAASGNTCKDGEKGGGSGQFGIFTMTQGIAVNQVTGDVYVSEMNPNYRVQQFDSTGNFIRMWGWDVNATNPSAGFEICTAASGDTCKEGVGGTGNGQFSIGGISRPLYLAVSPLDGNVFVADGGVGAKRIQRFSSTGSFIGLVGGPTQFNDGGFADPSSVAIDSAGTIYAGATGGGPTPGPVRIFDASGTFLGNLKGAESIQVAVDPSLDELYTTRASSIARYSSTGALLSVEASGIPTADGLAIDPSSKRIYLSHLSGDRILVLDTLTSTPSASIDPASDVTSTGATLNGRINPNGTSFSTGYHFEYRAEDSSTWSRIPKSDVSIGNGNTEVPVSASLGGLNPNTVYHVRVVATRELGAGSDVSAETNFITDPQLPVASLVAASRVTDTTARLGASVDPRNAATTYRFEFGTDASYGSIVPVAQNGNAGDSLGAVGIFEQISGLAPNTTYHFCIVASNAAGSTTCEDQTFTTTTAAAQIWPKRVLELVNQPNKGAQNLAPGTMESKENFMRADGNKVVWTVAAGTFNSGQGSAGSFFSTRGADGWTTEPFAATPALRPAGVSPHLNYQLVASNPAMTRFLFGATDGGPLSQATENALILATSPADQELLETANDWQSGYYMAPQIAQTDQGVSHVVTQQPPDQSAFLGSLTYYHNGDSRVLPTPACGAGFVRGTDGQDSVGETGVFYDSPGDTCTDPSQIYFQPFDSSTPILITGTPLTGSLHTANTVAVAKNATGILFSTETDLAPEDGNTRTDFYKWMVADQELECVTCAVPAMATATYMGPAFASDDLSRFYFTSDLETDGGGPAPTCGQAGGVCNFYVLRLEQQKVHYIGQYGFGDNEENQDAELTPTGDVIAFRMGTAGMTADQLKIPGQAKGSVQVFRYDDNTEAVECVSCLLAGVNKQSVPTPPLPNGNITLSDDGQTVAFNTPAALVRTDINGGQDLYEWHNGVVRLVTDGVHEWPGNPVGGAPAAWGLSANGRNLLMAVGGERLTGLEDDRYANLYNAGVGGGFLIPSPAAHCSEDACQGPLRAAPALQFQGSSAFVGPQNQRARRTPQRKRRGGKKRGKRRHQVRSVKTTRKDG